MVQQTLKEHIQLSEYVFLILFDIYSINPMQKNSTVTKMYARKNTTDLNSDLHTTNYTNHLL